ncbi:MAG: AMP-binding protein [Odoribacter sp.]|nr:AMP-binding protein [Odoribacter sp.]
MKESIITIIEESIRQNWEYQALSDLHGASFQYRDVARKIAKLHLLFEKSGVQPGDKIALCGRNCAHWSIGFLAVFTYGAVAVPILHEFKPDNVHHLVTHSDSKLMFVDAAIWENLDPDSLPHIKGAVNIADYSLLMSRSKKLTEARSRLNLLFGEKYPERFTRDDVTYHHPADDNDMAIINYTSGSTGFSKGVVLSYHNIWSNIRFCLDNIPYCKPGDGAICMLPLAHMFGLTIEMLHMLCHGCHVYFLTRTPSPRIIMDAFATVKPKLIITVPLIIEKIIKTRVFPLLDKPLMKVLLKVPFIDDKLLGKIKDKLTDTFGGNLHQLIIGGAGLNTDVETFLRRIKFPFTVGYGMTECAPLISYAPWDKQKPQSCGRIVDRMKAKIDSPDPANVPGTLWVKGDNVMKGYYKNDEATSTTFKDGWMNTGDICQMDSEGYLFIRGRDKSMILGPSGQNIYPEEIEHRINNLPYVSESLVVDRGGKLVALIHPDFESAQKDGLSPTTLEPLIDQAVRQLNSELPAYSQISGIKLFQEEFEKTPKRSIKRYLYQH